MALREIKFRGKRLDNGEWVYGSLLQSEISVGGHAECQIHERFAHDHSIASYAVDPKTVGQFAGRLDQLDHEIYEDDFIENDASKEHGIKWLVEFDRGVFGAAPKGMALRAMAGIRVIGNKHDNPEILI